jgi:hypothetical protein
MPRFPGSIERCERRQFAPNSHAYRRAFEEALQAAQAVGSDAGGDN